MKIYARSVVWGLMFILPSLLITLNCIAQQNKWKAWGVPELGYISGTYEVSGDIRLQGGVQKNGWNIGLGTGVDYYRFTSFPIYAQGRKFIGKKKGKPFVLTSMGINLPSEQTKQRNQPLFIDFIGLIAGPSPQPYYYDMGIYGELGAGYAFLNKKGRGLLLSLSYTQKRIKETTKDYNYMQGAEQYTDDISVYIMHRAAVRIGYKF
jgi:hypothetical protein